MNSGNILMSISVNGEYHDIDTGTTVAHLVERYAPATRGISVAIDGDIVPKSMWAETQLKEDCRVEIITAVAGG